LIVRFLGFEISRAKAALPTPTQPVGTWGSGWGGGWWPVIREPFAGAWQRNMEIRAESVLTYHAVYACITLIASDISKLRIRLVQQDDDGIWTETTAAAFSPVLRKPNRYQNRIKFFEQWLVSKLIHGNAYILKERDERKVVVALYILDPLRCKPLVAPDGSVYYQLRKDDLSGIESDTVTVPASEIIHDVMVPLYHPLCGVSPITACGLAAMQGLSIQNNSTRLFQNGARPGGVLTAPGPIDDTNAKRLKDYWDANFTGENAGKVAVLGDGLKFDSTMSTNAVDAQLIEQLKWTAETVCSCFHVPPYMIGVGPMPSYNNVQALNQQYYSQALQNPIECIELCLDEGLGLAPDKIDGKTYGTEFDLDDLLRMDTATQIKTWGEAVKGLASADEARKKLGLGKTPGGSAVLTQQQNYSLEAIAKRDAKDDPFASANPPAAPDSEPAPDDEDPVDGGEDDDAEGSDSQRFADIIYSRAKHHALNDTA
jgi:HK97 family phage portal protein